VDRSQLIELLLHNQLPPPKGLVLRGLLATDTQTPQLTHLLKLDFADIFFNVEGRLYIQQAATWFAQYAAHLSLEEFRDMCLPHFNKMKLRAPQLLAESVALVIDYFAFEFEDVYQHFYELAIKEILTKEASRNDIGGKIINSLLLKLRHSQNAFMQIIEDLLKESSSKDGKMKREVIFSLLSKSLEKLEGATAQVVCPSVIEKLFVMMKKDLTLAGASLDSALKLCDSCLHAIQSLSDDMILYCFTRGKDSSKPNSSSLNFLNFICSACRLNKITSLPQVSSSILSGFIKNAQSLPHQQVARSFGIISLATVAYSETNEKATRLWHSLLADQNSFIASLSYIDKCEPVESESLISFFKEAAVRISANSFQASERDLALKNITRILLYFSLNLERKDVSRLAYNSILFLVKEKVISSLVILDELFSKVTGWDSLLIEQIDSNVSYRVFNLLSASFSSVPSSTEEFAGLIVLSHHPFLQFSDKNSSMFSLWNKISRKWMNQPSNIFSFLNQNIESLIDLILSDKYFLSQNDRIQSGATRSLVTLLKLDDIRLVALERIISRFSSIMNEKPMSSFSEYEVAVFEAPSGQIVSKEEEKSKPIEMRSRKGKKEGNEDNSRSNKNRLENQKGKQEEDMNASQNLIREKMKNMQYPHTVVFKCLSNFCIMLPQFSKSYVIPRFTDTFNDFAQFPTMRESVGLFGISLAHALGYGVSCSQQLITVYLNICRSSQCFLRKLKFEDLEKWCQDVLCSVMHSFSKKLNGKVYHPIFLKMFLQLIRIAIFTSQSELEDVSFNLLKKHCKISHYSPLDRAIFPIAEITEILFSVISRLHKYADDASECLVNLSELINAENVNILMDKQYIFSSNVSCREAALRMLDESATFYVPQPFTVTYKIWILCNDIEDDAVYNLAREIWSKYAFFHSSESVGLLLDCLLEGNDFLRNSASDAIASLFQEAPEFMQDGIKKIIDLMEASKDSIIEDEFGRVAKKLMKGWIRETIVHTAESIFAFASLSDSLNLFEYILGKGLEDLDEQVFNASLSALLSFIDYNCNQETSKQFVSIIEERIRKAASISNKAVYDHIREATSILMGRVAVHLPNNSENVISILRSLLEILMTPSHDVQLSAARCISTLVTKLSDKNQISEIIRSLLNSCFLGNTYGERKGASFGLAGAVKGLRLSSLKRFGILDALNVSVNSKESKAKEGALFCYEALYSFFGSAFEPYSVIILPNLLKCFGESDSSVKEAAHSASKILMANLTSHGVKMVLPKLLNSLNESAWRSRLEAVNLLGSMSSCAPEQLSSSLPVIVPQLIELLKDPHSKVHQATQQALKEIGSVITNSEIQALVPVILDALYDPGKHTQSALTALMETSFVNFVDSAALALLAPILHRGLRERLGSTKRMAAQIIGSICSLLYSERDILPYLESFVKELKILLTDPSPDVRAACSKALGQLFVNVGESYLIELIEYLINILQKENSNVERVGNAQGLSELLNALGIDRMSDYMSKILELVQNDALHIRENFLTVLMFLPRALGGEFNIFLDDCIPCIFTNCASDKESVRSAALLAGKSIIDVLAAQYPIDILDIIEDFLNDNNWRKRQCAVVLVGDLLHKVVGGNLSIISGELIEFEEDDARKPSYEPRMFFCIEI
jgi:HEAT repeat protein